MTLQYTRPLDAANVEIKPSFFKNLMTLAAEKIIPYQREALNDRIEGADPSYCIRNFRAAAGEIDAPHGGFPWQDSDLAKWIEACAHMLTWKKDEALEDELDGVIDLIEKAQLDDGYVDTYYILTGIEKRWTNIRDCHELYCAGHLLEASTAYFKATGKRKLLDIMIRYVDYIASVFGTEEGKIHGYPGHEEIELALVKLYEITKDEKHLALAKYFVDERGQTPNFFLEEAAKVGRDPGWNRSVYDKSRYYQAHIPVREQKFAIGHSVRACYLYSAMADVARETNDQALADACDTLFKNIVRKQMYITGAIGQSAFGEAFTFDYDLPNGLVYGETCAAISLMFFAHRMLRLFPNGVYGDIMDKLIYNGTISGMNLEGDRFFYVNPLESWPERNKKNQQFLHIASDRRKWFGCACCPPNLARLISSLPGYLYHTAGNTAYFALYSSSSAVLHMDGGEAKISVETDYPWNGRVRIRTEKTFPGFTLALRLPGWVKTYDLNINSRYALTHLKDGYLYIQNELQAGDEIIFDMHMPAMVMRAHPRARDNAGRIALQRGPVVYCMEEIDNGENLACVTMPAKNNFSFEHKSDFLGGVTVIEADAFRQTESGWDEYELYADRLPKKTPFRAKFVPYYAWNNRGVGEMTVWVREE